MNLWIALNCLLTKKYFAAEFISSIDSACP